MSTICDDAPSNRSTPSSRSPNSSASMSLTQSVASLLQRSTEMPDSRYWTPYDHFMVAQQARALRRAEIVSALAAGVRALARWMRARFGGPASSPAHALADGARGG